MGTVNYYESVRASVGPERADGGVRLFMVPGMNHCRGGVGTDRFDAVSALDRWVSQDDAPARIEAERVVAGETVRTRPLCAYPQLAVYDGTGSTDLSENFVCR
jgi:feruloyl esterase